MQQVLNAGDNPTGRYLLRNDDRTHSKPYEATIVEWAPSGQRVKLKYPRNKFEQWVEITEHGPLVVERLPDLQPDDD